MVEQNAVHECRIFPDGEVCTNFLDGCFCSVDGSKGGVECEVEFLPAPCLAVLESGELVAISEDVM